MSIKYFVDIATGLIIIILNHFSDQKPASNTTLVTSVEGRFEATRDKVASEIRRLNSPGSPADRVVRNGVQVMPKEFIEDPQGSADRLEKPENIDKILPHNVIHEYYAPTTRVIFVLGEIIYF